jgi:hypothetical protein
MAATEIAPEMYTVLDRIEGEKNGDENDSG